MQLARTFSLSLLLLLLSAPAAAAEGTNAVAAEALYQEGRALMAAGKYKDACAKLAESQRLDPATGTLLSLAVCHESEGRLATAWAEFNDAEARARADGREDREKLARDRVAALRPRLSTLAIDVPGEVAATPGLELRVDGIVTGPGSFGVAVPVDGGQHRVQANAPGKLPFEVNVNVKPESDAVRVSVPALRDDTSARATGTSANPADRDAAPGSGSSPLRTIGLVTAGAGLVALGVGSFLALSAKSNYDEAKKSCVGNGCPAAPYEKIESARSQGSVATVVFIVGGAALATGAVLFFVAPSGSSERPAASGVRIERLGVGAGSLLVKGSF
jgi:serine/threonine-protein kinase